ncbi:MAG TPA: hypothetical protein VIG06_18060 [Kofleriaceae bacterium]|jgi:hypothetical protein
MKRFVLGFLCALSLAVAPGCGGDDDGGDTGDTADFDAAGGGGDAEAFCTEFSDTCGFTDWYNSQGECVTTVEGWSTERQACVAEHLGFAGGYDEGSADREMHCGHAGGDAPCN